MRSVYNVGHDTIVQFLNGVQIRAGFGDPDNGGQPYVTINTEELPIGYRYDERTGMRGDADPFAAMQGASEGHWTVNSADGTIATFIDTPTISAKAQAHVHANVLNDEWPKQCGMPIIAVHLNDVSIYDDEGDGQGNRAPFDIERNVYVVRPNDPEYDVAVFASESDADLFASTFDSVGDVERVLICEGSVARRMIRDRMPKFAIMVRGNSGDDITHDIEMSPTVDGWTEHRASDAREDVAIGDLSSLIEPEARVCLSQIIDQGREHGPTDDVAETLYAGAESAMNALLDGTIEEYGFFTPDGWTVNVKRVD